MPYSYQTHAALPRGAGLSGNRRFHRRWRA